MAIQLRLQGCMKCDERTRLLEAYNRATLALSTAVQHLLSGGDVMTSDVYDIHRRAADKARNELEAARLAYEGHIQEHHCEGEFGGGATNLEAMLSSV
ncbi:MAG TPA: hypothetical protein VLM42_05140 [Bryobacteraceae bacterium]|nr:hypothetical protein [Bryobacteraceae bacterium]